MGVLFPDYVQLQSAPSPDEFRGILGDDDARAKAAAIADLVFAFAYPMLGVIAFAAVATGVPRMIGTLAIVGSGIADELENVMVLRNIGAGIDLKQSAIDQMLLAGSVKWGLLVTAIVLFMALTGHRWLESRRA